MKPSAHAGRWRRLVVLLLLPALAGVGSAEEDAPTALEDATKLGEGALPCPSPDGSSLAFVRFKTDRRHVDYRGDPIPIPRLHVQALPRGRAARRKAEAIPLGWVGEEAVGLSLGWVVDASSGRRQKEYAALPEDLEARRIAWSPDGMQLAYLPDAMFHEMNPSKTTAPTARGVYLVDAAGTTKKLDLEHNVQTDQCAILSWSPDGSRLVLHCGFFRDGNLPVRRVCVVEVASGTATWVAMSEWHPRQGEAWLLDGGCECGVKGEGGMRENTPGTSRRGSPSCPCGAQNAWDGEGRLFAFAAMPEEAGWDAYVASADGKTVHRLTNDGGLKWSPCLDPAGLRIAWWQGEATGLKAAPQSSEIRIRHLYTGATWRVPAPEDAGVGSSLTWARDGASLFFETVGEEHTLWQQAVPAAAAAEDDASILDVG